jgi:UPF0755 protein
MGNKYLSVLGGILDLIFRVTLWAVIIYGIYTYAGRCYEYGYRIYTEPPISLTYGRDVKVTIPVDTSPKELGQIFEDNGLTRDALLFTLQYYCSEYKADVTFGSYTFNTAMTAEEMCALMAGEGPEVSEEAQALSEDVTNGGLAPNE